MPDVLVSGHHENIRKWRLKESLRKTLERRPDLLDKYDISILPLHILLGETEYRDGVDITPEEIFRWSDENKTTPKTSAPSMTEAKEVMKPFQDEGREIS